MPKTIREALSAHLDAATNFFTHYEKDLLSLSQQIAATFWNGGKLLIAGNGGSSCDAMHIAGEFVGRFVSDRDPLPAIALSADSGIITAVGNDYGFERIFSRQVEALGKKGDMLIALSTSGTSPNIIKALAVAKEYGLSTVLLTGEKGKNSKAADKVFGVDSLVTARIQEIHITALHILAMLVEEKMFPDNDKKEIGGQKGPEPTRYGDWENKGRVTDF